ncbi:methyltransferase domain-containing protein [candidate division KSB1 bacterium]|nr:methyltransferase domain-containing protein [candidate division KSB1 bacterium]
MEIDPKTGIWVGEDRHRIYDQTLAAELVALCRNKQFATVVDLGCGAGYYVGHLRESGIQCSGYDGNPQTPLITDGACGVLDLSKPISIGSHSCVISLEVGEHIPPEFEEIYLNNVFGSARNYVILSWARPGQGGVGHFNEKAQSLVIERIERDGLWKLDPLATYTLRRSATLPWFQNTIICFQRTQRPAADRLVQSAQAESQIALHQQNGVVDNSRRVRDAMFRRRMKNTPQALSLEFWKDHFCTQEALRSPEVHGRILDFGSGTGESDIWMARQGKDVVGFDISPVALDEAERYRAAETPEVKARVSFVLGNRGELPFPDQSFDAIFSNHALENIPHLTPTLKELARVLKPGGAFVALVSQGTAYYDIARMHYFERAALEERLSDFFDDVTVEEQTEFKQLKAVCRNARATKHPRIACIMRIRNEERWIKDVLDSAARVADDIVIVDDGSTDNTPSICKYHPAVSAYYWQNEAETDQRRDKQRCLEMALELNPDWIMGLDADEPLERSAAHRIFEAIRNCPADVATLKLESLFMWNDMNHFRSDGIYRRICQERLFRVAGQPRDRLIYQPTTFKGNGHCTRLPGGIVGKELEIDAKILHMGYMYPDVRARRYEYYRQRDPREFANGDYEHLLDQPGQLIEEWHERPDRREQIATRSQTPLPLAMVKAAGAAAPANADTLHAPRRARDWAMAE